MAFGLDDIIVEGEGKPPRIVFYGPMGIGKTTLGAAAPNPIFIQCEDGEGKVKYAKFPLAKSFDDVIEHLTVLYKNDHPYQTLVLDSVSSLEQLIHAEVRKNNDEKIFASFGRGHKLAIPYFARLLNALNALRDKGMMILLIGHSETERYEAPEVEPYDRYSLSVHKDAQKLIFGWCDCMFFANYKVFTATDELGFSQSRVRGIGTGQRTIYTEERPSHKAKNRYDLPYELKFEKPFNWDALLKNIGWEPKSVAAKATTPSETENE